MSKEIQLVDSDKTATCDSCCYPYLSQFSWHLMEDGRAGRLEPCEDDPSHPHLILMEQEVADRHRCEVEHQSGMWDGEDESEVCYECPAVVGEPHSAGCPVAICLVTKQRINCKRRHDCGLDAWSGDFPGTAEAIKFGFFSKWVDDSGKVIDPPDWDRVRGHWVTTTADDPDGDPDTELMMEQCVWFRKLGTWVMQGTK